MPGSLRRSSFGVRARGSARIVAVMLILGLTCLAGCSGNKETKAGSPGVSNKAASKSGKQTAEKTALQAEFTKARIIWNDGKGRRVMEARFKEAVASQSGKIAVVELRDAKADLYKDGRIAATLSAPRIVADGRRKEVRASGGVKIISAAEGASAVCDEVTWKSHLNKLFGAGSVRMTRNNVSVTADGFQADTALKKARFTNAKLGIE